MTYPGSGFPDYSRYTPSGGRQVTELVAVTTGDPSSPIIDTTGFSSLTIVILNNGNTDNFFVAYNFYETNSLASNLFESLITPDQSDYNIVNVQVLSKYFNLQYLKISGPSTQAVTTYVYGNLGVQPYNNRAAFAIPNVYINTPINAGITYTQRLQGMSPGPAVLSIVGESSDNLTVHLDKWNPGTAAWVPFLWITSTQLATQCVFNISMPASTAQISITNNSAGTVQVVGSVIPE